MTYRDPKTGDWFSVFEMVGQVAISFFGWARNKRISHVLDVALTGHTP